MATLKNVNMQNCDLRMAVLVIIMTTLTTISVYLFKSVLQRMNNILTVIVIVIVIVRRVQT